MIDISLAWNLIEKGGVTAVLFIAIVLLLWERRDLVKSRDGWIERAFEALGDADEALEAGHKAVRRRK